VGWTKHPDAVVAIRGVRSKLLANVRKLNKDAKSLTRLGSEDELLALAKQLHTELRRLNRADMALHLHERLDLSPYVNTLLRLVPYWAFEE